MKYCVLLFTCCLFVACGGGETATSSNDMADEVAKPTEAEAAPATAVAQPKNPCETLSTTDVASALGWAGANEGQSQSFYEGRLQGCLFSATSNEGGLTITITSSAARTIERKGVEASYDVDLSNEGPLTWRETESNLGDQSIYGFGKRGPNILYILRWRDGNEVDYKLEYRSTTTLDEATVLEQLNQVARKL